MSTVVVNEKDTLRSPTEQRQRRIYLIIGIPLLVVLAVAALWTVKVDRQVEARGFVVSTTHVELRTPQRGRVASVAVVHGELVKAGAPVLVLEAPGAAREIAEAQAALAAADARLRVAQAAAGVSNDAPATTDDTATTPTLLALRAAELDVTWRQLVLTNALDTSKAVVTAPCDGVILLYNVAPGTSIEAGQLVAEVYDPTHLELHLRVAERYANLVLNDQPVRAEIAAGVGAARPVLTGRVRAVEAVIRPGDRGGYRDFTSSIEGGAGGDLRVGGAVSARVRVGRTSLLASIFGKY